MARTRFGLGAASCLLACVALSCSVLDPYTGESKTSKATKGAVIGAAAGAAAGALTGDDTRSRRKRALIGAGLGALTGGSVGYYMDLQEAKLREALRESGVSVRRVGNDINLNMPGNVTFQVNRADLNPEFHRVLSSVAAVSKHYEKTMIEIDGHTDATGPDEYNRSLSERRADTVKRFFVSQGVREIRLFAQGIGENRPIASNDTVEGRALNRRVELTLVPIVE